MSGVKSDQETIRTMAKELAKDSIVTDALARLIEQVIVEIHETKIGPLKAEIEALKKSASLSAIYADAKSKPKVRP